MSRQLIIQGALYAIIGAFTPIVAMLAGDQPISTRTIVAICISALVAGATALKAFLSTTFADSKESVLPEPLALKRK